MKRYLLPGYAGFIGSNFVHAWLESANAAVVNLDKLTYAGNLANLEKFKDGPPMFLCKVI